MRRRKARLSSLFALALVAAIAFSPLPSVRPQTTPTRSGLVTEIEATAARHAKTNTSMQTQHMIELYAEDGEQVGLSKREIANFYEEKYIEVQETLQPGPWAGLLPNQASVVLAIMSLLGIIGAAFKDRITQLIEAILDWLYSQLAGTKFLQTTALNRYRRSLVDKHAQLRIPFRPNRPLEMAEVFVPLKVAGSASVTSEIDAYRAITEHRRLMVTGQPGSGKTMLLKHVALTYGRNQLNMLSDRPVPVLLELHRLSDPDLSREALIQELVAAFRRDGFPKAERFVAQSLKQGKLLLLLDGLDEVNSGVRSQVVKQIQDLLDECDKCRAIITCHLA
ncbi:MAG: NACHT domain-containing protein, partial [Leptolyngbya sp. SIO4C1]|nr:NACHT domain-containing protein [Leptolyngbya sp. SIO4C1]